MIHVCLFIGGALERNIDRRRLGMSALDVCITPPGDIDASRVYNTGAHCLFAEYSGVAPGDRRFVVPGRTSLLAERRSRRIASDLLRSFRENCWTPLIIDSAVLELLALSARDPQTSTNSPPRWLERVRDLLHDRFAEPLTMSEVAVEANVTPVHLSRAFKHRFGCSMGDYLRGLRLSHAREKLQGEDAPLARIAVETGFSDQSHMTRWFKRAYGSTPGAWRKQARS